MKFKFHSQVKRHRRITSVTIVKDGIVIGNGCTKQSLLDKDCRVSGQKYAVKDALTEFDRKDRKSVWNEFFKHSKKTRRIQAA